jgi:hypothetical protein
MFPCGFDFPFFLVVFKCLELGALWQVPTKKWAFWGWRLSSPGKKGEELVIRHWHPHWMHIFVEQPSFPNGTLKPFQVKCPKKKITKVFCGGHLALHFSSLGKFCSHWSV